MASLGAGLEGFLRAAGALAENRYAAARSASALPAQSYSAPWYWTGSEGSVTAVHTLRAAVITAVGPPVAPAGPHNPPPAPNAPPTRPAPQRDRRPTAAAARRPS